MSASLWLLLWLKFHGRLRKLSRGLRTLRGIFFALIGVAVLLLWLLPSLLAVAAPTAEDLVRIRRIGPLALLGFSLLNVLLSSAEAGITFTPAEISFLFTGPFARRELLTYKIVGNVGAALLSSLFITVFVQRYSALILAAFLSVCLILIFMQLLSMALALLANVLGTAAYNRRRRLVLGLLVILLGIAILQFSGDWRRGDWQEAVDELLQSRIVQVLFFPVRCFIEALTAEAVWPDLVVWTLLSALVNSVLIAGILLLDAQYLEASANASEKLYARLRHMRQGGGAMALPSGKARLAFPPLPRWGGVGVLLWRQLTTALRSLKSLILMAVFFVIFLTPMFLQMNNETRADSLPGMIIAMLVATTLIVPPMLPFDFRGDLDRLPFLKTLPLPAWRIAVGQVVAPVVVLSLGQCMVLGIVQLVGKLPGEVWAIIVFLIPVNFLIFAVENLFFLLFPTRQMASSPGDFQLLGRNIIIWLAKITAIGIALLPASLAGVMVFLVAGQNRVVGFVAGWCVLVMVIAGIVPLLACAFLRFDVARDMPAE